MKYMASRITTSKEILEALNKGEKDRPWYEGAGYYVISQAELEKNSIKPGSRSVALKVFLNKKTGEIKTYVAKWVDDKANELLE